MAEVPKPDDLMRRVLQLEARMKTLEDLGIRRYAIDTTSYDTTSSTSFVDLGPTLSGVVPGPGGQLLVGVTAGIYGISLGDQGVVSYRIQGGPTVVAASDDWGISVENHGADAGFISVYATRWALSPVLAPGTYDLVMQMRSVSGGSVGADGRGIIALPI